MAAAAPPGCELCQQDGGVLVWCDAALRVIRAEDADFPAFYRVVWNDHVAELSQLDTAARGRLMDAVVRVESVLRQTLAPSKINLASLGNVVPHLHWHVIARFEGDSRWPAPVWAAAQRVPAVAPLARLALPLAALDERIRQALATG